MSAKAVRARSSSYLLVGVLVLALVVGTSAQCVPFCLSAQVDPVSLQASTGFSWAFPPLLEDVAIASLHTLDTSVT